MATTKKCIRCHDTGFGLFERPDGDAFAGFDQDFCDCDLGQFCRWQYSLADDLEAEYYAVRNNCGHFESGSFNSTAKYWDDQAMDAYLSAVNAERCL